MFRRPSTREEREEKQKRQYRGDLEDFSFIGYYRKFCEPNEDDVGSCVDQKFTSSEQEYCNNVAEENGFISDGTMGINERCKRMIMWQDSNWHFYEGALSAAADLFTGNLSSFDTETRRDYVRWRYKMKFSQLLKKAYMKTLLLGILLSVIICSNRTLIFSIIKYLLSNW